MRQGYGVAWALGALGILLLSQSCATTNGPKLLNRSPASKAKFTMTGSSLVYDYERGRVDFQTTDLMDIYEDGVIDLLKSPDPKVRALLDRVPLHGEFYLVVMNGQHSPASLIQINDDYFFARDYATRSQQFAQGLDVPFKSYSFDSNKRAKPLKKLKLHLLKEAEGNGHFVYTSRNCVVENQPGPKGEYRNGALTIQLIDTSVTTFDPITFGAGKGARLLAEFSVFREHEDSGCR